MYGIYSNPWEDSEIYRGLRRKKRNYDTAKSNVKTLKKIKKKEIDVS